MTFQLTNATCDLESKRAYVEFRDETKIGEVFLSAFFI